ncbi:MAG: GNAT family N-acetyltransferase [bacterium]
MSVPAKSTDIIVNGDRIVLRKVTRADAQTIFENVRDREISRYTFIPHPYRLRDALHFIRFAQLQMKKGLEYHLGIELKSSERIIGMIGLMRVDLRNRNAEIGYWLSKSYWGQGLAGDALHLMLHFAFRELKLVRVYAHVMHPNHASARMLERAGFTREGCLRKHLLRSGRRLDLLYYGLLKQEYRP